MLFPAILEMMADAQITDTELYGLVFDNVKAFNVLSGVLVFELARRWGFPQAIVCICRQSTKGFPEGCPLSSVRAACLLTVQLCYHLRFIFFVATDFTCC